jgi:hypothetical protein
MGILWGSYAAGIQYRLYGEKIILAFVSNACLWPVAIIIALSRRRI